MMHCRAALSLVASEKANFLNFGLKKGRLQASNMGFKPTECAGAALFFIASCSIPFSAFAQNQSAQTEAVVVTAPALRPSLSISGFDAPLKETPLAAVVIDSQEIKAVGAQRLADLFKLDASVSDAYNAVGYIDGATIRGFEIDNKTNYRREGLPISADTAIGLSNKERVEILHGTAGLQAGVSEPGGLVNYVVKRPTAKPLTHFDLSMNSQGQMGAALDVSRRFGANEDHALRINLATDRLNAAAPGLKGQRQQAALALDSRLAQGGLLQFETELMHQSQPTQPGLSLLGASTQLPAPNPRLNLNQQSWSLPTVFNGHTGSLRYSQPLSKDWQATAQYGWQSLRTDDRVTFPFGCGNAGSGACNAYYDNGDVDLYDFRSNGERRRKTALQLKLDGKAQLAGLQHALSISLLRSHGRIETPDQVFNYAGTVSLSQPSSPVPAAPATAPGTGNRQTEQNTELMASDAISFQNGFKLWGGLRHTQLQRSDVLNQLNYSQNFNAPWLALSKTEGEITYYLSHGHGVETAIVPNLAAVYGTLAGLPLPAQRNRQTELGFKRSRRGLDYGLTLFDIGHSRLSDYAPRTVVQKHRGLEGQAGVSVDAWKFGGSVMLLQARVPDVASGAAASSLLPTNVPAHVLRLNAQQRISADWQWGAHLSREGTRAILPDNSLMLPAWTRLDFSGQWRLNSSTEMKFGLDNALNRAYFKESPYQFSHAYLFPAQPRTLRMSLSMQL